MFGAHQMVDDVRPGRVASPVAEPALADVAHDHAAGVVDAAVLAGMGWQLLHGTQTREELEKDRALSRSKTAQHSRMVLYGVDVNYVDVSPS